MKRTLLRLSIPFRQPFVTSNGVVSERELLLLRLEGSDGTVGWGEAAPTTSSSQPASAARYSPAATAIPNAT